MAENPHLLSYYAKLYQDNLILSYKGPINQSIIVGISREIEDKFKDNKRMNRKLFSIFMELAQNILYYSVEVNEFSGRDRVGIIMLSESETEYEIIAGNLIQDASVESLIEKSQYINTLDMAALRKYRLKLVDEQPPVTSKGAGIGLVKVALTSENPLDVQMEKVGNDFTFFTILVKINK